MFDLLFIRQSWKEKASSYSSLLGMVALVLSADGKPTRYKSTAPEHQSTGAENVVSNELFSLIFFFIKNRIYLRFYIAT